MKRFAMLGPGTFSEEAVHRLLKGTDISYELVPHRIIEDVVASVEHGQADYAVVPVENTIDGSVIHHMDLLIEKADLPIQAEWVYPVEMNLLGCEELPGSADLTGIHHIFTIPVAYAQCQEFIKQHMPHVELEPVSSTAEGAKRVKQQRDPGIAAIGTKAAAQLYDLQVLADGIQDHDNNFTRFYLAGKDKLTLRPTEHHQTTVIVTLPEDYPGALHQVLSAFAWRRINLSKIESRPTRKRLGSYYFYIDVAGSLDSVLLPAAMEEIEAIGCQVRILGSYPTYFHETAHSEV